VDVNALIELGPEEGALKIGQKALFDGKDMSDAKDAIDDLVDAVQYGREYMACAREASIPEADYLRINVSLDSLSEQATQYVNMTQVLPAAAPPNEPPETLPPINLVTAAEAESATPAPPDSGTFSTRQRAIIGVLLGLTASILVYSYVHLGSGTNGGGGGGTYSMYWSCGGQDQCASVMGGESGVAESGLSYSSCQALQQQWASEGKMQAGDSSGGTYCSP
jgi:hypothetical protein